MDKVKSLIEIHHGKMVPLHHNMTNYFQPLDLTVNWSGNLFLRDKVQIWYAQQVKAQICKRIAPESVFVDLKISILKGCVRYICASLFWSLNESTCQTGKNVFYFTSKSLFHSRENQILEFYIFKFHYVIKYLSIKEEIHFTE